MATIMSSTKLPVSFVLGLCVGVTFTSLGSFDQTSAINAIKQRELEAKEQSSFPSQRSISSSNETQERDFLSLGLASGTDKVEGNVRLKTCIEKGEVCVAPGCTKEECRPWGHFYDTMYQQWLSPYSRDDAESFQFLEIGFYNGKGFQTYLDFLPNAEAHSMEINCADTWPHKNNAAENKKLYQPLLDNERLHCGDASNLAFLHKVWSTKMNRTDAPPLKVVVDDGSHQAHHMIQSMFYWFPRIEPRGMLVVEDIQPIESANKFRTQFLPQIMADLHFCGDPKFQEDPCFPTLQPLLAGVHCEMHICVFFRNDKPAEELSLELSKMPGGALDKTTCAALQR